MKKENFKFQLLLFVKYFLVFTIIPIIGTLIHEFGHYIVAIANGYEANIAYAYTQSNINRYEDPTGYFYFILGGPLITWIQSILPFLFILYYYKKDRRMEFSDKLPWGYIISVGFAAVCGRFIFNAGGYLWTHSSNLDEAKMASYLGIFPDIFVYGFAFIAWTMLIVILYITPLKYRWALFIGAILGAVVGYIVWYEYIGPILLPLK